MISSSNGWAKIHFNGKIAFVSEAYLTNKTPSKNINDTLNHTGTYVIKSGDTFTKISKALGVSVSQIQKLNPGVEPTKLKVGQSIKIPSATAPAVNQMVTHTGTYVIKSNDTLTKIGKTLGFSVSQIQELNPGVEPTKLKIGQMIKIPSTTAPTVNQIIIEAQIGGVDDNGTFRFIASEGTTYTAKATGNMINELFKHQGKNATLTLEGKRGTILTLVSVF